MKFTASGTIWMFDLGRLRGNFKNPAGTFAAMESIRARSITDSLTATPLSGVPRPAQLTDVEKRIAELQLALLQTRSKNIRRRLLSDLDETEAKRGPEVDIRGRILLQATPVRLAQLQRILKPNEAVLEYFTSASSAYCPDHFATKGHTHPAAWTKLFKVDPAPPCFDSK